MRNETSKIKVSTKNTLNRMILIMLKIKTFTESVSKS